MNWFPVLAALAIVSAAILGTDSPGRTILLQVFIALIALVGLGIEWWKDSKPSSQSLRTR